MTVAAIMWPYAERSIERLVAVFEALDDAGRRWHPPAHEANSVATLTNHTIANAEENLLQTVGGQQVAYDRQVEFDAPETDPAAVRARWTRLREAFEALLPALTDERMLEQVDHPRRGRLSRLDGLVVVTRHAAEHLAQAELTRDLYHRTTGGQP